MRKTASDDDVSGPMELLALGVHHQHGEGEAGNVEPVPDRFEVLAKSFALLCLDELPDL